MGVETAAVRQTQLRTAFAASLPVALRNHARKIRHHRRRNRTCQRASAPRSQSGWHRPVPRRCPPAASPPSTGPPAARPMPPPRSAAPAHTAAPPRASPPSSRASAAGTGTPAGPSSPPPAPHEPATRPAFHTPAPISPAVPQHQGARQQPLSESPPEPAPARQSIKRVQHRGAVGGNARNHHQWQQRVENPDRKCHLRGCKVRRNQREEPRAPSAISTETSPSSRHIHSIELDSSSWARSRPSRSRTRINVGTRA